MFYKPVPVSSCCIVVIREDVQTSLQDVASSTEEGFSYKCKKCR